MEGGTPADCSPAIIRLGIIATLRRGKNRTGTGIVTSIKSILERHEESLAAHGLKVELVERDDFGDPAEAVRAAKHCFESGCLAVLGPSDSAGMWGVLNSKTLRPLPKLATFATASRLSEVKGSCFFRFTKSDSARVERLVDKIEEFGTQIRKVAVFSLIGAESSYAQCLRRDAAKILGERRIPSVDLEFSNPPEIEQWPERKTAVLICAPSAEAVLLIEALRDGGFRGKIFAFGSNANFLKSDETSGTVVVADLDRHNDDSAIRKRLAAHRTRFPKETDPSLPSMSAAEAIVSILLSRPPQTWAPAPSGRKILATALRNGPVSGISGPISFTPDGEPVGHESLSILCVRNRRGHKQFAPLRGDKLPRLPNITLKKLFYYGGGATILYTIYEIAGSPLG